MALDKQNAHKLRWIVLRARDLKKRVRDFTANPEELVKKLDRRNIERLEEVMRDLRLTELELRLLVWRWYSDENNTRR